MKTNEAKAIEIADDKKYKAMTETLRLLHMDKDVVGYLQWIIKSDTAKEYYSLQSIEKDKEIAELKDKLKTLDKKAFLIIEEAENEELKVIRDALIEKCKNK